MQLRNTVVTNIWNKTRRFNWSALHCKTELAFEN